MSHAKVYVEVRLHRPWYSPGDVVRATIGVWCTDAKIGSDEYGKVDLPHQLPSFIGGIDEEDTDSSSAGGGGGAAAWVEHLEAVAGGVCVVDSLRLNAPLLWRQNRSTAATATRSEPPIPNGGGGVRSFFSPWSWFAPGSVHTDLDNGITGSASHVPEGAKSVPEESARGELNPVELASLLLDSNPTRDNPHTLFQSRRLQLFKDEGLRLYRKRFITMCFTLPPSLPPSFSGLSARFYYGMCVKGSWACHMKGREPIQLRVPIKVCSPDAVLQRFCFPYVAAETALGEKVMSLPRTPSAAVSAPLHNTLFPREAQQRTPAMQRISAVNEARNSFLESNASIHRSIVWNGVTIATVSLFSCGVAIGESFSGSVRAVRLSEEQAMKMEGENEGAMMTAVKIRGSLEYLECCPQSLLIKGSTSSLLNGNEQLAVVASTIVQEQEWCVLDSPLQSFSFFIPATKWTSTIHTDLVCVLWQLRFQVVYCATEQVKQRAGSKPPKEIRAEDDSIVVTIPLNVVAPAHAANPRLGTTVVTR